MKQYLKPLLAIATVGYCIFFPTVPSLGNNDVQFFSVNDWKTASKAQSPEKLTAEMYQIFNKAFTEINKKYIKQVNLTKPISLAIETIADIDKNLLINITSDKIVITNQNGTEKVFTYSSTDKPDTWAKNLSEIIGYLRKTSSLISKLSAEETYKIIFDTMLAQMDPYSQYLTRQEAKQRKNKHHGTMDIDGNITSENNTHIKILKNGIAIITITSFDSNTSEIIENILNNIPINPTGLIIDLSNSNGGILRQSYASADIFINQGVLFKVKGRTQGSNKVYKASETTLYKDPIVIIINNETKSASEAFALSFKNNNRAYIIGSKSFGKGLVQTSILLPDKSEIMLSWAEIYDSYDNPLNKHGIIPDLAITANSAKELHQKSLETAVKYLLTP